MSFAFNAPAGLALSNRKKIIRKVLNLNEKGVPPHEVMIKLFGARRENPLNTEYKESLRNRLFNKLCGYRSFLISAIKHCVSHNCISDSSRKEISNLILGLEKAIDKASK